jgi:hypothetical protein
MTSAFTDPSLGTIKSIGRYFGLVSVVPTLLLTVYVAILIGCGSWTSRPDFQLVFDAVSDPSFGPAFGLVISTLVVALALHTIQFAIIQFLEGYWGGNAVMRRLRASRIDHHRRRLRSLQVAFSAARSQVRELDEDSFARTAASTTAADFLNAIDAYPPEPDKILPTRLGNVLRKHEDRAGKAYGLDVLRVATLLAMVAPARHTTYLADQRNALELAVRLCASGMIAFAATIVLMWPWDLWLFLAVIPYTVSYISYRGAIVAARHYGDALAMLVSLNRFRLYEAMHVALPVDSDDERDQNESLSALLAGLPEYLRYDHGVGDGAGEEPVDDGPAAGEQSTD